MAWFKRDKKSITTPTKEKKETPDGLWVKTSSGNIIESKELAKNFYVDPEGHHTRIGSKEYFDIIYDDAYYTEIHEKIASGDPLHFEDNKKYTDRITATQKKTGLVDACRSAYGKTSGQYIVVTCMDFTFIGGSMGSVVGEKIARAIDYAIEHKLPLVIISKSGGARMMESATSLMQMAKTSAKLAQLAEAKIPYISLCTDPTTGGTTASYAMLGDINIAEPKALIAFAGPRVVKDTTGKELPEGFQTSEFQLEKGFLDFISHRNELKTKINLYLDLILNHPLRQ